MVYIDEDFYCRFNSKRNDRKKKKMFSKQSPQLMNIPLFTSCMLHNTVVDMLRIYRAFAESTIYRRLDTQAGISHDMIFLSFAYAPK